MSISVTAGRAINASWVFGFNPNIKVYNLSNSKQKRQRLLLGHVNEITSLAVSKEKRWIVTGDKGKDSLMIVWDTKPLLQDFTSNNADLNIGEAMPILTIFNPHDCGIVCAEFSIDSKYIITLGAESQQRLFIWDWTSKSSPILQLQLDTFHHSISTNPVDPLEFMTTGKDSVFFYLLDKDLDKVQKIAPRYNQVNLQTHEFTNSCYIGTTGNACSGTSAGDLIWWSTTDLDNLTVKLAKGNRAATKTIRLHSSAIHAIHANEKFLFTGGQEGVLKVFDFHFRLVYWCERLNAGPISSISLSPLADTTFHGIVGQISRTSTNSTSSKISNRIVDFQAKNRPVLCTESVPTVNVIIKGSYGKIHDIVLHPEQTSIAIGGDSGVLQLIDPTTKQVINQRDFKKDDPEAQIHSIAFSPGKNLVACGFQNGLVRVLDILNLNDLPQSTSGNEFGYKVGKTPVTKIEFSLEGNYIACCDKEFLVSILHKETVKVKQEEVKESIFGKPKPDANTRPKVHSARQRIEWVMIGRAKSHFKEIVALLFPKISTGESVRLFSVSKDRHIAEYDLTSSNSHRGIVVCSIRKIEQMHRPLCAFLHEQKHPVHPEELIICANSGLKVKTFQSATNLCRNTVLGPTLGSTINSMHLFDLQGSAPFLVFSTKEKYIGISAFPLEGDPYDSTAILAHPSQVTNVISLRSKSNLISIGGSDMIMWSLAPNVLQTQIKSSGEKIDHYLEMLDPDGTSTNYNEFEDYFYYAQILQQGENEIDTRQVSDKVSLEKIPFLMQAMGFYPSTQEIDDMINQVKYTRFVQGQGEEVDGITFHDLIKLYLNHRPYGNIQVEEIELALANARRLEAGRPLPVGAVNPISDSQLIRSEGLVALLQQYESMNLENIADAFKELLDKPPYLGELPTKFTSKEFIQDILGMAHSNE